jgi:aminoglycoside 6'-N-acetyltransferase I
MVRAARDSDRQAIAEMRAILWPDASVAEHLRDLESAVSTLPFINLVAEDGGTPVGFIEVALRSHADGCDTARPVGFVEGWFVHAAFRHRGVGKELMRAGEDWARVQGCVEMASDTWVDHQDSQKAHEALGFKVVDRCVHYRKGL